MPRIVSLATIMMLLSCLLVQAQGLGVQAYGGQRGFDPNAPTHDVTGSVINAITGEPIARALVHISGPYQRSDLSDSQGSFRFEGVPEGQAVLIARKPAFFSSDEMAGGGGRPRTPVKITADMGPIVIKLTPEGIVTGTITGDDGEPLGGVNVRLKRQVVTNGRKQWEENSQAYTNEDGEFRVANLIPGRVYLVADAARMRTPRAAGESEMGYAAAYYPGVPDLSSAAPIEVRAGQAAQVDFRLRKQPIYQIRGAVTGVPPGQRGVELQIINSAGESIGFNDYNSRDGTFNGKLPAGTYTIRASMFEQPRRSLIASATVTVAGNISNLRLPLQPGALIPVLVKTEFTTQQSSANIDGAVGTVSFKDRTPWYASVSLMGLDSAQPKSFITGGMNEDSSPTLRDVEPGRYAAQINPHGPWYVQSATYGQTDLLLDDLVVASGGDPRPIEIVLRDDAGSIKGSVMSDNVVVPATLLAVPERRSTAPQPVYASEGRFALNMLAPGDYLLFAFDSTDGLEYSSRDALEPYVSRATRVSVSSNSSSNVTLTLIKQGEP